MRVSSGAAAVLFILAFLLAGFLITRPTDELALDNDCSPENIQAQFSARLYGDTFLRKQQAALGNEIGTLQNLRNASTENPSRPADMTPIEERMRRLSDKARAALAATDDQLWRDEILSLGRCEGVVQQRLAR